MHSFFAPKAKKQKLDEVKRQPESLITWNVNGMLSVVADKSNKPVKELKDFVDRYIDFCVYFD